MLTFPDSIEIQVAECSGREQKGIQNEAAQRRARSGQRGRPWPFAEHPISTPLSWGSQIQDGQEGLHPLPSSPPSSKGTTMHTDTRTRSWDRVFFVPNPINPPPKSLFFSAPSSPTTTALSQVSPSHTWTIATGYTKVTGTVHPSPMQQSFTQSHQLLSLSHALFIHIHVLTYLPPTDLASTCLCLSISLYLPIIYLSY